MCCCACCTSSWLRDLVVLPLQGSRVLGKLLSLRTHTSIWSPLTSSVPPAPYWACPCASSLAYLPAHRTPAACPHPDSGAKALVQPRPLPICTKSHVIRALCNAPHGSPQSPRRIKGRDRLSCFPSIQLIRPAALHPPTGQLQEVERHVYCHTLQAKVTGGCGCSLCQNIGHVPLAMTFAYLPSMSFVGRAVTC